MEKDLSAKKEDERKGDFCKRQTASETGKGIRHSFSVCTARTCSPGEGTKAVPGKTRLGKKKGGKTSRDQSNRPLDQTSFLSKTYQMGNLT